MKDGAEPLPHAAPPDEASSRPGLRGGPDRGPSPGGVRALLELPAKPHGLRARSGAELPAQGLLEPFQLDQCATDIAAGGTRPGHGQVRLLVGGLLGEHVVPSAEQT